MSQTPPSWLIAGAAALAISLVAHADDTPTPSAPVFVESAAATGLAFTHVNGATGSYYLPEVMGAGVALFDYDNDGDLDVFLVQGGPLSGDAAARAGRGGSGPPTCRLFRNDLVVAPDGRRTLRFTDVTAAAGVGLRGYGMGAAVGDYDNDGHADLFVTSFGSATLLHNNGDGTFTDVTKQAGVSDSAWSTSAAFVDYDRDGFLDLFVAHYVDFTTAANKLCNDPAGARDYCSPRAYRPVPARLFRNDGRGHFVDVTAKAGITRAYGAGLGVAVGDYNGDGWPDIYVANDGNANQLWINKHDGTFVDQGLISGAALSATGVPEGSMGIASGDFDLDGDEDLFVTNIVGETSVLYVNDGHGLFDDARVKSRLGPLTAAFTGFGTDWFDYDNDGWPDLFVANGAVNIVEALRGQPSPYRMRNQLFHNTGAGRFEETSAVAGPAFARAEISRGAAFGDIDNDGDVDVVVTNNNGPVRLLLNQLGSANHWLQIRLEQQPSNRFGIGSWIRVERAGRPTVSRRVRTDGSYLSASDVRAHFGLGSSPDISAVIVQWPDGGLERWTNVKGDRLVVLRRGTGQR
ncbi:MAG TPA: CRTAC1 family protein [Vicinamibacterales bacterium]|nr:CRTAC1 family protein [Vicinamibacterales bacterium]